jgi:bacterioferritin
LDLLCYLAHHLSAEFHRARATILEVKILKNFAYRLFKKTSEGSGAKNRSFRGVYPELSRRIHNVTAWSALKASGELVAESPFLTDVKILCERARRKDSRAARASVSRDTALRLLNEALATEIVCVLRYKRHYFMACGIKAKAVAQEFLEHAKVEQDHADQIAARIVELGGEPNFSPKGMLSRSRSEYVEGESLIDMIREDLVAKLVVIESYREMINNFGNDDAISRQMLEAILAAEEERLGDLAALLEKLARPA